jgi:hypothetical protein
MYLRDDDLVEVETCRRDISDKWLFTINCAICLINYYVAMVSLATGTRLPYLHLCQNPEFYMYA